MRGTIIALSNQKGGVGKTTTCANLGIGLAMEGKKVLVVDADPQSSLSISLGYPQPDQLPVTITDLMKKVILDKPITEGEGILHQKEGVDLLPASIELAGLEASMVNVMSRETILRQVLNEIGKPYDGLYALLGDADHQCPGGGGQCADSGSGPLSARQGPGAAFADDFQGSAADQS